jgi:hypothetical protein
VLIRAFALHYPDTGASLELELRLSSGARCRDRGDSREERKTDRVPRDVDPGTAVIVGSGLTCRKTRAAGAEGLEPPTYGFGDCRRLA